jgi:hypothetical protein
MRRSVCTVATGLLRALVSTGTATATGLPLPGQSGTQVTGFGDQTVGEQSNDADLTQKQGNGNLNIAPAVAIFGDAETTNAQGNGNTATANVDQSTSVAQSQSSEQKQSLEKQKNEASVTQKQGTWNGSFAPAIGFGKGKGRRSDSCYSKCEKSGHSLGGGAETTNKQGNGNTATAVVGQSNSVEQSQSAYQRQSLVDACKGLVYR